MTDWWGVPNAERFRQGAEAYRTSRFAPLSMDFLSRFSRDPDASPSANETVVDGGWRVALADGAPRLVELMAGHLRRFLDQAMGAGVELGGTPGAARTITLAVGSLGAAEAADSFELRVEADRATLTANSPAGCRDGVVKLIDLMGFRQAPYLERGTSRYTPRLAVRLGTIPKLGAIHDAVLGGYNAVLVPSGTMRLLSTSKAIPELVKYQDQGALERMAAGVAAAQEYGLKSYAQIWNDRYAEDDPIWRALPDARGARCWAEDGDFVLCTEHAAVQQFMEETVAGIFEAVPGLDGIVTIVGGESFYHCYMRPYGAEKGHTTCPRCERLGPYRTVANLCNRMARGARSANPTGEVVAWLYSGSVVWSEHPHEVPFIELLEPGTAVFTEMEKDERILTPHGADKWLWDYSVHMVGPGPRAAAQVEAGRKAGVPVYLKNEPELSFEAARLPQMPTLDLWLDRAEATAACGSSGAWEFPALRPSFGTSGAEVSKHVWWSPAPSRDELLDAMAARIAGREAAPHLRRAWALCSAAIAFSPELPPYYTGAMYLGPGHPMCVVRDAELPEVFLGRLLFYGEITAKEGDVLRPTYHQDASGPPSSYGRAYQQMRDLLAAADDAVSAAEPLVPDRCRLMFDSEASTIRLFYRTVRTTANFHESCAIRDSLGTTREAIASRAALRRWLDVLEDERENVEAAVPVVAADIRVETHVACVDHLYPPLTAMLDAKLELLRGELRDVAARLAAL